MAAVNQIRHGIATRPATMTSTADGRNHLISEQATATGLAAGRGEYVAICGHLVVAAALVVPPGATCFDCETALHRITTGTTVHRCGLVARLLSRCFPRPGSRSTIGGNHRAGRA
ncbi:MAG: hypothetical protein ACRD0H_30280 [Actinomycetes bacterium]